MAPSPSRPWLRILLGALLAAAVIVGCGFDLAGLGDFAPGSGPNLQPGVGPRAELFVISPAQISVSEKSMSSDTFKVRLSQAPSATVTLPLAAAPQGRLKLNGALNATSLTFTPDNFGVDQTVTVTVADRNAEIDPGEFSIDTGPASSADALFDGSDPANVKVLFEDANEAIEVQPRLNANRQPFSVSEKGTTTNYNVSLNAQPTDRVVVHLHVTNANELELALADNSGNAVGAYATDLDIDFPGSYPVGKAQTFIVRGKNDDIAEKPNPVTSIEISATSPDKRFDGKKIEPLLVENVDDDTPNLLLSKSSVVIGEPSTSDTFTVSITTQPTAPVTVSITNGAPAKCTLDKTTLTFNAQNWKQEQTVTVTAIDNQIVEGTLNYTLTLATPTTGTSGYENLTQQVAVTNNDDDHGGVVASPASIATNENGTTAQIAVHLKLQPIGDVYVSATSNRTSEATVQTGKLTFTTSDWNQDQFITIRGENDDFADGQQPYQITVFVDPSTPTASYLDGATSAAVTGANSDNDTAAVVTTGSPLALTENGAPGSFFVHLNSQPVTPVFVRLSAQASNPPGTQVSNPSTIDLTFDGTNWKNDQQATFSIADDCYEGNASIPVQVTIRVGSDVTYFTTASTPDVTINVTDNDTGDVVVSPQSLSLTHGGSAKTFTVQPMTRPRADIKIPISSSNTALGDVDVSSLTFPSSDATCPPPAQTVTVTPKNGSSATGNYTIIVGKDQNGIDPFYKNLDPHDVSVSQN